jgi:hypothetical protein
MTKLFAQPKSMPFGQKKEPAKKAGVLRFFSLDLHQVSTSVQTVTHVYRWVRLVTASGYVESLRLTKDECQHQPSACRRSLRILRAFSSGCLAIVWRYVGSSVYALTESAALSNPANDLNYHKNDQCACAHNPGNLSPQVFDWNVTGYGDPAQFGFKR